MPLPLLDPLPRFIAQVIAIVLLARLLGRVARRVGQPMVVAEIAAGIILGPSLLGWISPDLSSALFAPESLVLLQVVSNLGLVLFMFLVGLELDAKALHGRGRASLVISQTTFLVPLGLGIVVAIYLYARWAEPGVSLATFALFVGAAMSSTAFPVLARILNERRLLRSRVGALTIACAAIDDVLAWCLLAFAVASARAGGISQAIMMSLWAALYIGVMFFVVRPLLRRLAKRVGRSFLTHDRIAVLMVLLFASSWATELIGIHALFGAFLFGALLPREGGLAHALSQKLGDVVIVVLLPLFFAYSGVRTQIGLLDTPAAWTTCGVLILVASVGKLGAGTVAARLSGLSWRESGALGALMNTRGLMVLIVLNIGLDFGIISPILFTMLVLMALVTTLLTTPVLDAVYPLGQHVADLLAADRARVDAGVSSTRGTRASRGDAYAILACVADDRSAQGLVAIANAFGHARVHAIHLTSTSAASPDALRALPDPIKTMAFPSHDPAVDICRIADVKAVDLVLVDRRAGPDQRLLGRCTQRVIDECGCDVAVLLRGGDVHPRAILLHETGSAHDEAARKLADRLHGGAARVHENATGSLTRALEEARFDLVIAGLPDPDEADRVLKAWLPHRDRGVSLVLVRGAIHHAPGEARAR